MCRFSSQPSVPSAFFGFVMFQNMARRTTTAELYNTSRKYNFGKQKLQDISAGSFQFIGFFRSHGMMIWAKTTSNVTTCDVRRCTAFATRIDEVWM